MAGPLACALGRPCTAPWGILPVRPAPVLPRRNCVTFKLATMQPAHEGVDMPMLGPGSSGQSQLDILDHLLTVLNDTRHPTFSWVVDNSSMRAPPVDILHQHVSTAPGHSTHFQPPQAAEIQRFLLPAPNQADVDIGSGLLAGPLHVHTPRQDSMPTTNLETPMDSSLGACVGQPQAPPVPQQVTSSPLLIPLISPSTPPLGIPPSPGASDARMSGSLPLPWLQPDGASADGRGVSAGQGSPFAADAARAAFDEWSAERPSLGAAPPPWSSGSLPMSLGLISGSLPMLLHGVSMELGAASCGGAGLQPPLTDSAPASQGRSQLPVPPPGASSAPAWCANCTMQAAISADNPSMAGVGSSNCCPFCHHPWPVVGSAVRGREPARSSLRAIGSCSSLLDERTAGQAADAVPSSRGVRHSSSASLLFSMDDTGSTPGGVGRVWTPQAARSGCLASPAQPRTLLGYDERMLAHEEPPSPWGGRREHPERPARLTSIMHALDAAGLLNRCQRITGRPASDAELCAVHDPELVRQVDAASAALAAPVDRQMSHLTLADVSKPDGQGGPTTASQGVPPAAAYGPLSRWIADCPLNEHTATCARLAAGTAADVVRAALVGHLHGAAIIRPPGHHAESALSLGFCIYNNVAVAARAAQADASRRVLIVDWDVHHGNGTQHAFYDDPSVLFISIHRYDDGAFYPGTGAPRAIGTGPGIGFNVNIGWPGPGMTDADYMLAFRHIVVPMAEAFSPDLVLVSAGFDAAAGDPLGECLVSSQAFGHFTQMLSCLGPPCVLCLEGGYNLAATASAATECVRVLVEGSTRELPPGDTEPSAGAVSAVLSTLRAHAPRWPVLQLHLEELVKLQAFQTQREAGLSAFSGWAADGVRWEGDAVAGGTLLDGEGGLRSALSDLEAQLRGAAAADQHQSQQLHRHNNRHHEGPGPTYTQEHSSMRVEPRADTSAFDP